MYLWRRTAARRCKQFNKLRQPVQGTRSNTLYTRTHTGFDSSPRNNVRAVYNPNEVTGYRERARVCAGVYTYMV